MRTIAIDELASPRERFFANIIDGLLFAPIVVVLITFAGQASIVLSIALGLLYHWYWWTHFTGQTPGKKIINIRIVKADGSEMNDTDAIIRYFACCLSLASLGLGWLMLHSNPQRQAWHDKIAATTVIKNY